MPKKKLDICIVADRSGSLTHDGDKMNEALASMLENIRNEMYLTGCEIYFTLVSFSDKFSQNVDFAPLDTVKPKSLKLTFGGHTNPGPALKYVVDKAYQRYHEWRNNDEDAFHPLIFFFTDAQPYPAEYIPDYIETTKKIRELEDKKKLVIVGVGYGSADISMLKLITNKPAFIIDITGRDQKKLTRFFKEIIKQTTVKHTTTKDEDEMIRLFRGFEAT